MSFPIPTKIHYFEILTPNVAVFGDGAYEKVISLNEGLRGRSCSHKSDALIGREGETLSCEDTARRQLSAQPGRQFPLEISDLGLPASRTVKNKSMLFKPPSLCCFYSGSLRRLRERERKRRRTYLGKARTGNLHCHLKRPEGKS